MRDSVRFVARDERRDARDLSVRLRARRRIPAAAGRAGDRARGRRTPARPMPYACGLHPGFRLAVRRARPRGRARAVRRGGKRRGSRHRARRAVLGRDAAGPLRRRDLPLDDALFAREALCFLDAASRSLRFEQADGSAMEMTLEDFPHIALWSRPGAPFLCLEAWTGYGDPVGFAGDLFEKPSMRVLNPGSGARHAARFRYVPAALRRSRTAAEAAGLAFRGGFRARAGGASRAARRDAERGAVRHGRRGAMAGFRRLAGSRRRARASARPLEPARGRRLGRQFGAAALFPFEGPPYWPFQRWAQRAEPVSSLALGAVDPSALRPLAQLSRRAGVFRRAGVGRARRAAQPLRRLCRATVPVGVPRRRVLARRL